MKSRSAACALVLVLGVAQASPPAPSAPLARAQDDVQAPTPGTHGAARLDLRKALAAAARENRRVLVRWEVGSGDDSVTNALEAAMGKGDVRSKLTYEYDVVKIDASAPWAGVLAEQFGLPAEATTSPPRLIVLNAKGELLAHAKAADWASSDESKPLAIDGAKVMGFLTHNQAPYLEAAKVRDAAFARAKAQGKQIFLIFGAPW